jgi:hypothetical protein
MPEPAPDRWLAMAIDTSAGEAEDDLLWSAHHPQWDTCDDLRALKGVFVALGEMMKTIVMQEVHVVSFEDSKKGQRCCAGLHSYGCTLVVVVATAPCTAAVRQKSFRHPVFIPRDAASPDDAMRGTC